MFNKNKKEQKPVEKKLSDFDEKTLNDMRDKTTKQVEELTKIDDIIKPVCKQCGGLLHELNPKIKMEDLILNECSSCGEREYLKVLN